MKTEEAMLSGIRPLGPHRLRVFRVWLSVCKSFVFNVFTLQGRFLFCSWFWFSVDFHSRRRSYYLLFFYYLFLYYLYVCGLWTNSRHNCVWSLDVENPLESHKPVEIGDLRAQGASKSREALEVQTGPPKPSGAIPAPGKGGVAD